ncbi:MAG TPA: signal peptide peptidase SppA [Sphingomonas sp.]|nr:signal peptide peptidase SppA [Sphingomonas sp.]
MKLIRGAWKVLVGIKDALVLIFMLLFFGALFAALNARPGPATIRDGALLLDLHGTIVEQPHEVSPTAIFSGQDQPREYRLRDLVRALDAAKDDTHVKAVVLDLDRFGGGYPEAISEVANALGRVRASGKPVLAYATAYTDSGYRLASEASEIWVNPMGGSLFMGPGGSQLYYKGLIDKLGVDVHVYRVGKFKSYVEPYTRADASPEAKEADRQLYEAIFEQWQQGVKQARPKAQLAQFLTQPDKPVIAAGGDIAKANLAAGIVDKLGDRIAFGKRVAAIAGVDSGKPAGSFDTIDLDDYIDAHPAPTGGDAIGVITVAGDIVDGKGGPGEAAGDTISKLVLDGLAKKDLKALVVRVDSPGGSAFASEQIRQAILQAKAQKLPVIVSMGSLAASGGYWVSTAGDMIFAEPNTITGSIGIFGIIPTFENTLKKIGVTTDGVKTTPLSGQPDVVGGTNPTVDAIFQAGIEHGYNEFLARVAEARHMTPERVNEIGQGHVWDGGTARQLGLVDRFGTLKDAIAEAAKRAGLDPAKVHPVYLEKKPSKWAELAMKLARDGDDDGVGQQGDAFSRIAAQRRAVFADVLGDMRRISNGAAIQARCLECGALGPARPAPGDVTLMHAILAKLGA